MKQFGNTTEETVIDKVTLATQGVNIDIAALTSSDITAISAVVVAIVAVGISLWQGYVTRRHNHLSVKPDIGLCTDIVVGHDISCSLFNNGIGPAFIKSLTLSYKNEVFNLNKHEAYKLLFSKFGVDLDTTQHLACTYDEPTFSQNTEYMLFKFTNSSKDTELRDALVKYFPDININITYECIYGNSFETSTGL
ncbi:hypothetical protein ACFL3P_01505 [Pseudomonadota bacterium]